jgi:DNA polymerase-4
MHIDMNAFFAAVEQQSNPALRGKPVAVTGREKRTVILTASYQAREQGIKTGMRVDEALRACPELIIVPANNRLYTHVSSGVIDIFNDYTPSVEVFSIDEAFLDVSGSLKMFGGAQRIAYLIKSRIKVRFGITCSVGIAANKLLAKLASGMQKPDGLTTIDPSKAAAVLEDLPVGALCGIGRQTVRRLNLIGVFSCGQLGRFPLSLLRRQFGIVGDRLRLMGQGIDPRPVLAPEQEAPIKSVGHSMTLRRDISDPEAIRRFLLQLSEMVGRRARRYGVFGKTVTLTLRYADFQTFSKRRTGSEAINRSDSIYQAGLRILEGLNLRQPLRLIGISLSGLQFQAEQYALFPEERKRQQLTASLDIVNGRHGDFTVMPGSLLDEKGKGSHVISPAWRPEGIRNINVL